MTITMRTDDDLVCSLPLVSNRVAFCHDANPANAKPLPRTQITHLVIHRTDLDKLDPEANPYPIPNNLLDGVALASRFKHQGLGTAGCVPYHFLIRLNDAYTIEQMLPLSIRGAHAIGYNWRSIGVALVGDFTKYAPAPGQYDRLVSLVATLLPINGGLLVGGHTDLPGAAGDARKVCPGPFLPIGPIKTSAEMKLPPDYQVWGQGQIDFVIAKAGIVL